MQARVPFFKQCLSLVLFLAVLTAQSTSHASPAEELGQVNINTATVEELSYLPRIGPSKAEKIIEYRQKRPFQTVNALARVKGIGLKSLKTLKPFLTVTGKTTLKRKIKKADLQAIHFQEQETLILPRLK